MAAPDTWFAPSSGGTISGSGFTPTNTVSHAGDYWFALSIESGGTAVAKLRYATDPSGSWGTATLPAAPPGYTTSQATNTPYGVVYGGTVYATFVSYSNGSTSKVRILHTGDPTGTWNAYEYDATDVYVPQAMTYADGKFVLAGRADVASPRPAFIAYSTTANGTYTFGTAYSSTGYDPSVLTGGGTRFWLINGIDFDGTTWVTKAQRNDSTQGAFRASTSLTASWGTPTATWNSLGGAPLVYHDNGWWTSGDGLADVQYSNAPASSWSSMGSASVRLDDLRQMVWANDYWAAVGAWRTSYREPRVHTLGATGSPSGTYGTAVGNAGFTDPATTDVILRSIHHYGGTVVASSDYRGELRYCTVGLPATGPTYLRLHQSPVYTPSRVRGVDLRNRQTPRITR
jgi:hypothetical protein